MAKLEPFEVIMKIDFSGSNGLEIVAHAEKVAELVRCKDCKYWDGEKRGQFWYFEQCSLHQHIASCDDFCSFAERRTDE